MDKEMVAFFGGIGALILALIIASTIGGFDRRAKWAEAVKNGADPMTASCALFDLDNAEKVTCALLVTKK